MAIYDELMSNIGKGAKDIATKIAGNNYAETIFPTKAAFADELGNAINKNTKLNIKLHSNELNEQIPSDIEDFANTLKELGEEINIDGDKAKKIARVMHGTDYSEKSFQKLSQALQKEGFSEEMANRFTNMAKQNADNVLSKEIDFDNDNISIFKKAPVYAQTYFSNPDKKIKNTRIATAAATYAGVTIGGRYLSGGTLTSDNYGQKDIAGIPFL